MAWTKAKMAVAVGVGVLLAAGATTFIIFRPEIEHHRTLAEGRRAIADNVATPIDLAAKSGASASVFGPMPGTVPSGFQVFNHVPLQIEVQLCLWGGRNADGGGGGWGQGFPEQIPGIEVNRKFETLYIYHGAFFTSPDRTPVCEVVFRYEDGSSATNQLLFGLDIVEKSANPSKKARTPTGPDAKTPNDPTSPNSRLAWIGGTWEAGKDRPMRFCLTAVANPRPSVEVTTIDLYSCKSPTTACIMAMTTGRAGLMKWAVKPK